MNNAGVMKTINLHTEDQALEALTREIDINFKGPVWMAKRFLPQLKKMPSAAIVNVSSGLAFVPLPSAPVYCATKAAMNSFTRSLRVQLKKTAVKVFELAPPATITELFDAKSPDMEGVTLMQVDELVRQFLKGFQKDQARDPPGAGQRPEVHEPPGSGLHPQAAEQAGGPDARRKSNQLRRQVIARDGTSLAVRAHPATADAATRASFVLTNGLSTTPNFWSPLIAGLAPAHRVLDWSYRGHGESELSRSDGYAIATHADVTFAP